MENDNDISDIMVDYERMFNYKINKQTYMTRIFNWLVWSSANSEKISLTLKAGIPFLVLWGISDTDTLTALTGSIGEFLASLGQVISLAVTIFGLIRKIWYTFK